MQGRRHESALVTMPSTSQSRHSGTYMSGAAPRANSVGEAAVSVPPVQAWSITISGAGRDLRGGAFVGDLSQTTEALPEL